MLSSIISNKIDVLLLSETTIDQTFPIIQFFIMSFGKLRHRSNHRRCSVKKGFLRNFAKFTGKHLCQSLRPATLLERVSAHVFSCEFCKISKNTFFYRTPPDDCFCRQEFSGWGHNVSFKLLKTEIFEFDIDVLSVETKKVANVLQL